MAKKIKINVLQSNGQYEQLLPETTADQVLLNETLTVKNKINAIDSSIENHGSRLDSVESQIITISDNIIIASNSIVGVNDWNADSTYENFPLKANITITGCTAGYVPDVCFNVGDATSGLLAPVAQSLNGKVAIWASANPSTPITIPTIKLIKES